MNALRSYRLENGYAIFADSKQRLQPLSFLSRTGNVWQAFLLLALAFLPFYKNSIRRINIRIDSKRSLRPYGSPHSRLASFRMLSIGEALALLLYMQQKRPR